jgi:tryptophan 2-monooxygenase
MSFFVKPSTTEHHKSAVNGDGVQRTYIDILYDHAGFLRANGGKLGPGDLGGKRVCVIGAGPAGLSTAYLLRKHNANVTVLEASDRVGGRIDSFRPKGDAAIFEMGAMRVPPSEQLFGYFWNDVFNLPSPDTFPDPGKVDTKVVFQNQVYDWPAGGSAPPIFDNVSKGWSAFTDGFAEIIADLCDAARFHEARPKWQKLVYTAAGLGPERGYSLVSFFQGLVQAFTEHPHRYGCTRWTEQDFALFGALGLGSGGFGPLYSVNFAEIIRLVVNGLETNQQFYSAGLGSLTQSLGASLPDGSVRFRRKVTAVYPHRNGGVHVQLKGGGIEHFDHVVIATTTRAMQVDMMITEPQGGNQRGSITNEEATAVQELHLMNSSKLFVLTKTKFWKDAANLPQNIQTDGLVRGLYCLDYPDSTYGVVLVSYTWGDDSTKYIALKDPRQRLEYLIRSLEAYEELEPFVSRLRAELLPDHTELVDWQDQPNYYGAFKLNLPGQDAMNQRLYYQFLNANQGIVLAGDSVGWCGGWIEGALQTGVNATAAIIQQTCGPAGLAPKNPMTQDPEQYVYGP